MALVRKLFKRNKKNSTVQESAIYEEIRETRTMRRGETVPSEKSSVGNISGDSFSEESKEGTDIDSILEEEEKTKRKLLNHALRKVRRQEERLTRHQKEVIAMEKEISELMWLIALAKKQRAAIDEEVLNKKCEMKFLKKEAPECCEAEVKKREPLFYKKYNAVKTSADAKTMLHTVRQRQRALQYLELMLYNKYLEFQYGTKSEDVKKRTALLSKDKTKNFGHLVEALNLRSNLEVQVRNQTSNSDASPTFGCFEDFISESDDPLAVVTTAESPTTDVQTESSTSTPHYGTSSLNGLLFHLATPPRGERSPTPLLESML